MYQQALTFITKRHNGHKRRNGNPYIIHPIRVSQEVHSITEKVVALLHDVIEDTSTTIQEIEEHFGIEVATAVEAITKRPNEDYLVYIRRVKVNPIATKVKIADISDNLSDSPSDSAIVKSAHALELLIAE